MGLEHLLYISHFEVPRLGLSNITVGHVAPPHFPAPWLESSASACSNLECMRSRRRFLAVNLHTAHCSLLMACRWSLLQVLRPPLPSTSSLAGRATMVLLLHQRFTNTQRAGGQRSTRGAGEQGSTQGAPEEQGSRGAPKAHQRSRGTEEHPRSTRGAGEHPRSTRGAGEQG